MYIEKFEEGNFNVGKRIFKDGGVLIYPTDTVYGLGGDPFREEVVNKILNLKGRSQKPLPILIDDVKRVQDIAFVDKKVLSFMVSVWPSALTIVVNASIKIPACLHSDTVGLRIPNDEILLKFLSKIGGYIIGTSANPTGKKPATNINEAIRYFGNLVDIYYDGGVRDKKASTVIKFIDMKAVKIIRIGEYPINQLKALLYKHGLEVLKNEV